MTRIKRPGAAAGAAVLLAFSLTACGGAPDDASKDDFCDAFTGVFEPFVSFRKRGLGLGLTISRSIVDAHEGSIRAENNADGGATFRCFFPVVDARALEQTG